jgi:hypothetical protein
MVNFLKHPDARQPRAVEHNPARIAAEQLLELSADTPGVDAP